MRALENEELLKALMPTPDQVQGYYDDLRRNSGPNSEASGTKAATWGNLTGPKGRNQKVVGTPGGKGAEEKEKET